MSNVEKLSIALTPDLASLVRNAVAAGDYASSSEVMRDALRVWKHRRAQESHALEGLRALAARGIESGMVAHDGMDGIKAEGRRRLAAQKPS